MIHFELTSVCGVMWCKAYDSFGINFLDVGSNCIPLHVDIQLPRHHLLKRLFLHIEIFLRPC